MRHSPAIPTRLCWLVLAALVLTLSGGGLAGCSGDEPADGDTASSTQPSARAPHSQSAAPEPGTENDPNSPFVVAAGAVAERSVNPVVQLHAMGVATTVPSGDFPRDQVPTLAKGIAATVTELVETATTMTPPPDSPAARLATALGSYRRLARELSDWSLDAEPMPVTWFDRLTATDADWKAALDAVGKLTGEDYLVDVPELLMPA